MTERQQIWTSDGGPARRMLSAWLSYRADPTATKAHDENQHLSLLMIFSFSALALSLFAVELFPSLIDAIAAYP